MPPGFALRPPVRGIPRLPLRPVFLLMLGLLLLRAAEIRGWAAPPTKLAGAARLDLNAGPEVEALEEGEVVGGGGSVDRQIWLGEAEQPLTYMIHVPVVRFAWNEFEIRFVPRRSGTVHLGLRGPWEEQVVGSGRIYRQEVFWDAFQATGTVVDNAGFERVRPDGGPQEWSGGRAESSTAAVPAVDGLRLARTWHDDSMGQTVSVTGGVPVSLRFRARARIPDGFTDMGRIPGRTSAGHRAARRFMRGVNFGNNLELSPSDPGRFRYGPADFALARAEGFDHVRLPVAWHYYAGPGPEFRLPDAVFEEVGSLVGGALDAGLAVILDVHHFDPFVADPAAHTDQLLAMWDQIATRYAGAPATLAFEVLNEPRDAATTAVMNPIFAAAIDRIRRTNPARTLFIGTGAFNGVAELNALLLPDGDDNLIATVHTYDPFLFTHQGLPWAGTDAAATAGIRFPGPPEEPLVPPPGISDWATNWIRAYNREPPDRNPSGPAAFTATFRFIRQWSEYYGRPVHVGEFGAAAGIGEPSRLNYYRAKRAALDAAGIGWAIWDWKAGFHYSRDGLPDPPGLREALFPSPLLRGTPSGALDLGGAVGKMFVVERAARLGPVPVWTAVSTQVLDAPNLRFADPGSADAGARFYRVRWVK